MPRPAPRIHKLPHRLDYTLIPPPLDLSLPLATEKSPLPAIIVTPSSPASSRDFAIAFLAPPPKRSIFERIFSSTSFKAPPIYPTARATIIVFILVFVAICHIVTHQLAARRPHLDFSVQTEESHVVETSFNWLDFRSVNMGDIQDNNIMDARFSNIPPSTTS